MSCPISIYKLYAVATIHMTKSVQRVSIENTIFNLGVISLFINNTITFYINTLSGTIFRKELMKLFRLTHWMECSKGTIGHMSLILCFYSNYFAACHHGGWGWRKRTYVILTTICTMQDTALSINTIAYPTISTRHILFRWFHHFTWSFLKSRTK